MFVSTIDNVEGKSDYEKKHRENEIRTSVCAVYKIAVECKEGDVKESYEETIYAQDVFHGFFIIVIWILLFKNFFC